MSNHEQSLGSELDPTAVGHIAGEILDAVATHDRSSLDEAVKALNQDLSQFDLRVVPTKEVDPRTYTPEDVLRAERIAHLIDMGGVINPKLSQSQQYREAARLVTVDDSLPTRQRGDKHFVKPYDGSKDAFNDIRENDRAHYVHLQTILRHKRQRR